NQVQYLKDISLYPYSVELYGRKTLYCRSNRPTKNPNNTAGPTILAGRKVEIAYSISDAGVVCGDSNPSFIKIYSYQDANYVWQLCNLFIDSGMVGYTGGGSGYQYIQTYGSW
ncbi:MAG: hypothetical protein GX749_01800, partial [Ruminococcaceae bacterium]|nr:hypothetical protein [Oscillospiraceae bacterium]